MDAAISEIEASCEETVQAAPVHSPGRSIQLADGSMLERYGFMHEIHRRVLYMGIPQPGEWRCTAAWASFRRPLMPSICRKSRPSYPCTLAKATCTRARFTTCVCRLRMPCGDTRTARLSGISTGPWNCWRICPPQSRPRSKWPFSKSAAQRGEPWTTTPRRVPISASAVECARQAGRIDWEVRALLMLSAVLFWTDQNRSLEVAERAMAISRTGPDLWLHTQAAGYCASRRIRLEGWSDADFQRCMAAAEAARAVQDRTLLGLHTMSCAFFHSYRSAEREAIRWAEDGLQIALETNDPYLYISCQYFKAWALLHIGEWGATLRIVRDAIRLSEENGHGTAVVVLLMIEARLRIHAGGFAAARELGEAALGRAREGFRA